MFKAMLVRASREDMLALLNLLPTDLMTRRLRSLHEQGGNDTHRLGRYQVRYIYDLVLSAHMATLRVTQDHQNLSLKQVRKFEKDNRLDVLRGSLRFIPEAAEDMELQAKIDRNIYDGRRWDFGLSL